MNATRSRTLSLASLLATLWCGAALAAEPGARPTQVFRDTHKELQVHLGHVKEWVGSLDTKPQAEREAIMKRVTAFLREHIGEHAKVEEARLYPLVDRYAHDGALRYTDTMRWEHGIIGKKIEALEDMANGKADATGFARSADRLLGIIEAHFEKEEEVLLPVLDARATAKEVEDALGGHGGHHAH
ncbi:MAG: hypothetical protein AMXMBFR64_55770 [Myxococcales bacterium]